MQGRLSWWWFVVLALLLLAPGPAGRLLLDVAGGLTLLVVVLPLALGGAGWIAWQVLRRRFNTCPACGFRSLGNEVCPACGTLIAVEDSQTQTTSSQAGPSPSFDARDVTIDVQATDVDPD